MALQEIQDARQKYHKARMLFQEIVNASNTNPEAYPSEAEWFAALSAVFRNFVSLDGSQTYQGMSQLRLDGVGLKLKMYDLGRRHSHIVPYVAAGTRGYIPLSAEQSDIGVVQNSMQALFSRAGIEGSEVTTNGKTLVIIPPSYSGSPAVTFTPAFVYDRSGLFNFVMGAYMKLG